MQEFVRTYLTEAGNAALEIIDLGAHSVDGSDTYRPLFENPAWRYRGLDLVEGINVDLVAEDPYHWKELADASVDVLVSGQTLDTSSFPGLRCLKLPEFCAQAGWPA